MNINEYFANAGDEQKAGQDQRDVCGMSPIRGAVPDPLTRGQVAHWSGRAVRVAGAGSGGYADSSITG